MYAEAIPPGVFHSWDSQRLWRAINLTKFCQAGLFEFILRVHSKSSHLCLICPRKVSPEGL